MDRRVELLVIVGERWIIRRNDERNSWKVRFDEEVESFVAFAVESAIKLEVAVCRGKQSVHLFSRRASNYSHTELV